MKLFNWAMAEELAAEHMRQLGFHGVRRRPDGPDGGIDVDGSGVAAQVKHWGQAVGIAEVQRLRGTQIGATRMIFYARSGFTISAQQFADQAEIALFEYNDALEVRALNRHAREIETSQRSRGDATLRVARHCGGMMRLMPEIQAYIERFTDEDWIGIYVESVQKVASEYSDVQHRVEEALAQREAGMLSSAQLESELASMLPSVLAAEKSWSEVWGSAFEKYMPQESEYSYVDGAWRLER